MYATRCDTTHMTHDQNQPVHCFDRRTLTFTVVAAVSKRSPKIRRCTRTHLDNFCKILYAAVALFLPLVHLLKCYDVRSPHVRDVGCWCAITYHSCDISSFNPFTESDFYAEITEFLQQTCISFATAAAGVASIPSL